MSRELGPRESRRAGGPAGAVRVGIGDFIVRVERREEGDGEEAGSRWTHPRSSNKVGDAVRVTARWHGVKPLVSEAISLHIVLLCTVNAGGGVR